MKLVPVQVKPQHGCCLVLHNSAYGYVATINCIYLVGKGYSEQHARKIVRVLNSILKEGHYGNGFSDFRAEVYNRRFPVGAKNLNAPLRVASENVILPWLKYILPSPIEGERFDDEAVRERQYDDLLATNVPSLVGGAPCSVQ